MEISPDNKIYIRFTEGNPLHPINIGIIHNPNEEDKLKVNFEKNAYRFVWRFPLIVTQFPQPVVPRIHYSAEITGDTVYCAGDTLRLRAGTIPDTMEIDSVIWSHAPLHNDTVLTLGPLDSYDEGYYRVTVYYRGIPRYDTVYVKVLPPPDFYVIPSDNKPCEGKTVSLEVSDEFESYLWSTGEKTRSIEVTRSGEYTVEVTNDAGCSGSFTKEMVFTPGPDLEITGDTVICRGELAALEAVTGEENNIRWSTGAKVSKIEVDAGTYWARAQTENGCVSYDTINVIYAPDPEIEIVIDGPKAICEGKTSKLRIKDANPDCQYEWEDGSAELVIIAEQPGIYKAYVTTDEGCRDSASVEILRGNPVEAHLEGPDKICNEDDAKIHAYPRGDYEYLWNTGETTNFITATETGNYSCTVTNASGS